MSPSRLRVRGTDDGGCVVGGTSDVDEAREAVRLWAQAGMGFDTAEEADEYTDGCAVGRRGWFRWNPCHPNSCWDGGGHCGHLDYRDGPGRGHWQGIEFYS